MAERKQGAAMRLLEMGAGTSGSIRSPWKQLDILINENRGVAWACAFYHTVLSESLVWFHLTPMCRTNENQIARTCSQHPAACLLDSYLHDSCRGCVALSFGLYSVFVSAPRHFHDFTAFGPLAQLRNLFCLKPQAVLLPGTTLGSFYS